MLNYWCCGWAPAYVQIPIPVVWLTNHHDHGLSHNLTQAVLPGSLGALKIVRCYDRYNIQKMISAGECEKPTGNQRIGRPLAAWFSRRCLCLGQPRVRLVFLLSSLPFLSFPSTYLFFLPTLRISHGSQISKLCSGRVTAILICQPPKVWPFCLIFLQVCIQK